MTPPPTGFWRFFGLGVFLVLAIVIVYGFLVTPTTDCGTDTQCFTTIANNCGIGLVKTDLNGTTLEFTTRDCILHKRIGAFDPFETVEMQSYLSGKEMQCPYAQDGFNQTELLGLTQGMESCSGPLKDAILQLRLAALVAQR